MIREEPPMSRQPIPGAVGNKEKNRPDTRRNRFVITIRTFLLVNAGLLMVAAGIHFFKIPNGFATGGVSGLSIIVSHLFPSVPVGPMMGIINILLLGVGFASVGRKFGALTVYSSFALSGMVWLFDLIIPLAAPLTGDRMLELIFAIVLPAVGSAIVFNQNASTGGTDIVAKILSEKTSIEVGKALFIADFFITAGALFAFGVETGLYSMLGLFAKGFLIDLAIESFNMRKQLVIICGKPDEVIAFIMETLHRGATVHEGYGAYTHAQKRIITTVMNRHEAVLLRKYIRELDPASFITITNTSEIIGKGFRTTD